MSLNVEATVIADFMEEMTEAYRSYRAARFACNIRYAGHDPNRLEHSKQEAAERLEYAFKAFAEAVRTVELS